jgi:hypothetical protein
VKEQARDLRTQLQDLAVTVAASKARSAATELSAVKGFSYDDLLHAGLATMASVHGDIAEQVGTTGTMQVTCWLPGTSWHEPYGCAGTRPEHRVGQPRHSRRVSAAR